MNFIEIAKKAMATMFRRDVNPELVTISVPGSSGARVSIFKDPRSGTLYAVKCAFSPRISLCAERARRDALACCIPTHVPEVLWCDIIDQTEVMISQCGGLFSLHQSLQTGDCPQSVLLDTWRSVLAVLTDMWTNNQEQFQPNLCPRPFAARLDRIRHAVRRECINGINLGEHFNSPILINGQPFPSISTSFATLADLASPRFGVVCQGDPQPSNVVLGEKGSWYFVDWEWAGPHHDWRGMVSHLKGWWHSRCTILRSQPDMTASAGVLRLDYDSFLPEHLTSFAEAASNLSFVAANASTERDLQDINRYLAALYFGELRFLKAWGRSCFSIPLLAQAVITAHQLGRDAARYPFQFPTTRGRNVQTIH